MSTRERRRRAASRRRSTPFIPTSAREPLPFLSGARGGKMAVQISKKRKVSIGARGPRGACCSCHSEIHVPATGSRGAAAVVWRLCWPRMDVDGVSGRLRASAVWLGRVWAEGSTGRLHGAFLGRLD